MWQKKYQKYKLLIKSLKPIKLLKIYKKEIKIYKEIYYEKTRNTSLLCY